MKRSFAILLALAPLPALAQNAITQVGTVVQNSPVMFAGDRQARQGAGAAGAATGRIITTGDAVVGGRCDFSGPTDTVGGYNKLCLDATNGKLSFSTTKSPPANFAGIEVNGTLYPPTIGAGNVSGPGTTIVNEIASWNSTTGNALRQGAAQLTDDKTGVYSGDDAGLTVLSKTGITAMQVANITCNNCGYTNYDALRGVAVANAGNDVLNTTGVAGYVRNQQATGALGLSKNAVALIGFATGEVDGSQTWGLNTVTMDNSSTVIHAGARSIVGYEADLIVTSPLTATFGVYIIGNSLTQPTTANGYTCAPLGDPFGSIPDPIHWISCYLTSDGAAIYGLALGANSRSGTNVGSQVIDLAYFDATGTRQRADIGVTAGVPRTLLLTTTEGIGTLGLGIQGNFYQTAPASAHFMGANSKAALLTDAPDNLYIASGAWTSISLGTAAVLMTVQSPVNNTQNVKLASSTVAALPACNAGALGALRTVTDANAPAYGATVAGGGAVVIPVICDGVSAWKAH